MPSQQFEILGGIFCMKKKKTLQPKCEGFYWCFSHLTVLVFSFLVGPTVQYIYIYFSGLAPLDSQGQSQGVHSNKDLYLVPHTFAHREIEKRLVRLLEMAPR